VSDGFTCPFDPGAVGREGWPEGAGHRPTARPGPSSRLGSAPSGRVRPRIPHGDPREGREDAVPAAPVAAGHRRAAVPGPWAAAAAGAHLHAPRQRENVSGRGAGRVRAARRRGWRAPRSFVVASDARQAGITAPAGGPQGGAGAAPGGAAWAACVGEGSPIRDDAEVVLGFDGSYSGDATAIVAVQVPGARHGGHGKHLVPRVARAGVRLRPPTAAHATVERWPTDCRLSCWALGARPHGWSWTGHVK
jgi:hypothetical protein